MSRESPEEWVDIDVLTGKGSEEEVLAAPDVQCPKLRKKLLRRAKKVLIVVVLATLLFLVPTFFLFGMLINHLNEDKMCGAIGQLSAPECTHVSWEFCAGASSLGLVILFLLVNVVFVFVMGPAAAEKRQKLRAAATARAAESP